MPLIDKVKSSMVTYNIKINNKELNTQEYYIIPVSVPRTLKDITDIYGKTHEEETPIIKLAIVSIEEIGRFLTSRLAYIPQEKPIDIEYGFVATYDYKRDKDLQHAVFQTLYSLILNYTDVLSRLVANYRTAIPYNILYDNLIASIERIILSFDTEAVKKLNMSIVKKNSGQKIEPGELFEDIKKAPETQDLYNILNFFWIISAVQVPELSGLILLLYVYLMDYLETIPLEVWIDEEKDAEKVGLFEIDFTVPLIQTPEKGSEETQETEKDSKEESNG